MIPFLKVWLVCNLAESWLGKWKPVVNADYPLMTATIITASACLDTLAFYCIWRLL